MNGKQMTILIIALGVSALIVWHSLPIEFPWIITKVIMLFAKLFVVLVFAVFGCVFTAGKKRPS
jgi:hypothetical protein